MRFCTSVSLVALLGAIAAPSTVAAQETSGDAAANSPEAEIIVTGYRSSNQASIEAKREATGIIDAVSQDEAGLLPDLDINEIAQRIPGVSVISTFGVANDRSSDDTDAIVIRGLNPNYNLTTFDGVPVASTDEDDRRTKTSIFPPSAVSRVEVAKTLTADRDPHGLSGQLNLVTASAFDRKGTYLTTRLSVGTNETAGKMVADHGPDLRADATFSTIFGDGKFGFVAAGSYGRFYSTNLEHKPGAQDDTYLFYVKDPASTKRTDDLSESNGFPASRRNQIFAFEDERERIAGIAKLEFRPTDMTAASLYYGHFEESEKENRWEHLVVSNNSTRPANQTQFSGDWPTGQVQPGFVSQPEKTTVDLVTAKLDHAFDERNVLRVAASGSWADIHTDRHMSKFQVSGYSANDRFSYDLSSGRPVLTYANPDSINDLSRYNSNYVRQILTDAKQRLFYGGLDFDHNLGRNDRGFGFNIGVNYTRRRQSFDRDYFEGDVFNTDGCTQSAITKCPLANMRSFVLDKTLPGYAANVPFYLIDGNAFYEAWNAQGRPITNDRTDDSISSDYKLLETVTAAYAQAVYRTDDFMVRAGLRYDRTRTHVDLFAKDDMLDDDPDDAAQFVPQTRKSTYDFWLPSLILRYEPTDGIVLRAGYGRTIGRPNFDDYARGERIGEPEDGRISISRGNPDLRPRVSDNFDVSAEYYFDGGDSMVSLTAFHKHVADMIYVQEQIVEGFQYEGETLTAVIEQPVNANSAWIRGIEFGLRKDFRNLLPAPIDGFILEANATWIDGRVTLLDGDGNERRLGSWEKQPKFLTNVQLAYEKGPFGAKVAWNYVGDYLNNANEESALYDIYRTSRHQVDLQARYKLTPDLRVQFEVQNLTKEGVISERRFPFGNLLAQETEKGRRFWLGVNWRFGR
ncbi:MAG: hypothetical protein CVT77_07115 [Alphaproteobacteria bacterium HGW-Alphaproteobacteria-16]|nr:MAG: hypothetical protein CVT77_07115 [Alphaproteobacteria bacterium HGW-Alphaproteobacteria-16]